MTQFHLLIICVAIVGVVNCQSVDDLIDAVFSNNETQTNETTTTSAPPKDTPESNKPLDDLINDLFPNSDSAGPSTGTLPERISNCTEKCVPYYMCRINSADGDAIIDIRFEENQCENYLEVCCSANRIIDGGEVFEPPKEPKVKRCGVRNPDGVGFKITGNTDESEYGEFPWMVAVSAWQDFTTSGSSKVKVYQCGGALINPSVVLTAAHCVARLTKDSIVVRAGEWDVASTQELYPHQERNVSEIRVHPYYFYQALYNNVALLFLDEPVVLGPTVDLICLPEEEDVFDDDNCLVSGWGKNVFGKKGRYQEILKKVNVKVVPEAACQISLRNTRLGPTFELHETFICAGGENGRDTCKGDGGSPMVCPLKDDPTRYKQAGVVSWGIDCGTSNSPGVFANVALFREWIDEELSYKDLDSTLYQVFQNY